MSGIVKQVKRYLGFGILTIILLVLLWIRVVTGLNPKPQPPSETVPSPTITTPGVDRDSDVIKQPTNVKVGSDFQMTYKGGVFNAPREAAVLSAQNSKGVNLEQAKSWAGIFGVEGNPTSTQKSANESSFYFWKRGEINLSVGGSYPVISYIDNTKRTTNISTVEENELVGRAREELIKLNLIHVDSERYFISYYQMREDENGELLLSGVGDSSAATHFAVGFTYTSSNNRFIGETYPRQPITLMFNSDLELTSVKAFLVEFEESRLLPVRPFNETLSDLETKGVIFSVNSPALVTGEEAPEYLLQSVDLFAVELSYYLPILYTPTLNPIYVFKGKAINVNTNTEVDVVVVVPAVK